MKLCMIGTGYVGLVSGVCFADLGNEVICVDKDLSKINSLKKGKVVKRGRHSIKHSNKRSLTRRRCHDLKKGKRISVTKTRKLSNKDVQSIA